jgi:hypothetical protein
MPPGFSSASASGTWHSRFVYSGVASMLQDGICSSSCRHTRSPGAAAGVAHTDRAYSCSSKRTHTSAHLQQPQCIPCYGRALKDEETGRPERIETVKQNLFGGCGAAVASAAAATLVIASTATAAALVLVWHGCASAGEASLLL